MPCKKYEQSLVMPICSYLLQGLFKIQYGRTDKMAHTALTFRKLLLVEDCRKTYPISRKINSIADAKNAFNTVYQMDRLPDEVFAAIFLDSQRQINGMSIISHGSLNASIVTMRELFKNALAFNTHSMFVAHNHPSGSPTPSPLDETITETVRFLAEMMDIVFCGHLIIANQKYFGFTENYFSTKKLKTV